MEQVNSIIALRAYFETQMDHLFMTNLRTEWWKKLSNVTLPVSMQIKSKLDSPSNFMSKNKLIMETDITLTNDQSINVQILQTEDRVGKNIDLFPYTLRATINHQCVGEEITQLYTADYLFTDYKFDYSIEDMTSVKNFMSTMIVKTYNQFRLNRRSIYVEMGGTLL